MRRYISSSYMELEVEQGADADLDQGWLEFQDVTEALDYLKPLQSDHLFLAEVRRLLGDSSWLAAPASDDDQQLLRQFAKQLAEGELRLMSTRMPTLRPVPVLAYLELEQQAVAPASTPGPRAPVQRPQQTVESLLGANPPAQAQALQQAAMAGSPFCEP